MQDEVASKIVDVVLDMSKEGVNKTYQTVGLFLLFTGWVATSGSGLSVWKVEAVTVFLVCVAALYCFGLYRLKLKISRLTLSLKKGGQEEWHQAATECSINDQFGGLCLMVLLASFGPWFATKVLL